jgi:organic hydroperoxide reductase OsmC/OhrA
MAKPNSALNLSAKARIRRSGDLMEISAILRNSVGDQVATVRTEGSERQLSIPAKDSGPGSGVNGGELLMLALATCYCNDLYREAVRLGITLDAVEVEATASFPGIGLAAANIRYRAKVSSPADPATIADLLRQTDAVAEVHNTVRAGVPVVLLTESSGGP